MTIDKEIEDSFVRVSARLREMQAVIDRRWIESNDRYISSGGFFGSAILVAQMEGEMEEFRC
jgi:hypothetical protein